MNRSDLTRWNRAGLSRFRYVDGNAATYLEGLRAAMETVFADQWPDLATDADEKHESTRDRLDRWLAQYHTDRRDYGWEILRTLARSTHVLTEHLDAYANESYLGTATQWDSVARLVAMLDYHPAPGASATVPLAFEVNEEFCVGAGFQIRHTPDDGAPLIFETLVDLDAVPCQSAMRPLDWDRSQAAFAIRWTGDRFEAALTLDDDADLPNAGDVGVLEILADDEADSVGYAVEILAVDDRTVTLGVEQIDAEASIGLWRVRLHVGSDRIEAAELAGDGIVVLAADDHGLVAGDSRVTWQDGSWKAATVEVVNGDRIRLSGAVIPPVGTPLYLLARASRQETVGHTVLPEVRDGGNHVWNSALNATVELHDEYVANDDGDTGEVLYEYASETEVFYVPDRSQSAAAVATLEPDGIRLSGSPDPLTTGSWLVLYLEGGARHAARVITIEKDTDGFELTVDQIPSSTPVLVAWGYPDDPLPPAGHDRNDDSIFADVTETSVAATIRLADLPESLAVGRRVLVASGSKVHDAAVLAVDAAAGSIQISPPPTVADIGEYPGHETTIHANVVESGHGETKPIKTLGSGDATQTGQVFELAVEGIAYVPDASLPGGVRPDIEVYVDSRRWNIVGTLRTSSPTDDHYTVRITEAGTLTIGFGDGTHGRRLPTGSNNVRATYRKGSGEAGNLEAGSLEKSVKADPRINAVLQPAAAVGGSGSEPVSTLKESAPKSVLTLERAVALPDFANLAGQHASVWQAHSYQERTRIGRHESVRVVIVPAGGGTAGALLDDLTEYLSAHALPGVSVVVEDYVPIRLSLEVRARVHTESYDLEDVDARIREALLATYDIQSARLGEPLFRSQLIFTVEQVAGVANSMVTVLDETLTNVAVTSSATGEWRSLRPRPNQLVFIDPELSEVTISTDPFSL